MVKTVHVDLEEPLQKFIGQQISSGSQSVSEAEYIRSLVRERFEFEESRKWGTLEKELAAGLAAGRQEFAPLDMDSVIRDANAQRDANAD